MKNLQIIFSLFILCLSYRFPFPRINGGIIKPINYNSSEPVLIHQQGAFWSGFGQTRVKTPNYLGHEVIKNCNVTCIYSRQPETVNWADAIIYEGQPLISFSTQYRRVPLIFPEKSPNQYYINFGYEQFNYFPILGEPPYQRLIDINVSYDQTNGIPITLACDWGGGTGIKQFNDPPSLKTKSIAYMASNCYGGGALGRTEYLKELMEYIQIDSYGGCLKNRELPEHMNKPIYDDHGTSQRWKVELFTDYRFVLAFENNNITDYVTEKIFVALKAKTVPIYMGADNIDEWIPGNHSIIRTGCNYCFHFRFHFDSKKMKKNLLDGFFCSKWEAIGLNLHYQFSGPKALAEYLRYLMSHPNEYEKYFEWKKMPLSQNFIDKWEKCTFYNADCRLCNHLHELKNKNGAMRKFTARKAILFDPSTAVLTFPNASTYFNLTSQYSFSCWIYPTGIKSGQRIIDRTTSGSINGFNFDLFTIPKTSRTVLRLCAAHQCFLGRKSITEKKWFHVAVSFDSTIIDGVSLYVNGVIDTVYDSFDKETEVIDGPLTIGASSKPFRLNNFVGMIDELSIWTKPLSLSEVQSLQFHQLIGDEINLMCYFPFNEIKPETIVQDLSINKLDLIIHGTLSIVEAFGKPLYISKFM